MKPFEIFRTGSWTSDKGITKEYTEADLDKIIENYNSEDPAPIVIGHPTTNAPAYGWVESLKRIGDRLIAVPKQLNEKFVDLVKNGAFKKRSISITPELKLNHIGFLGAAAPAVEGLSEIQFSQEIELDNYSSAIDDVRSILRESAQNTMDLPDDVSNNEAIEQLNNDNQSNNIDYAAAIKEINTIVSELKQNFSQLSDKELNKIHNRINELQFSMQVNDFELRLNEKLAYGNLTPGMKTKIMDLVSFLQKQNFSNSEFSFDKYISSAKDLILDFVEAIPKIIYYENFAQKEESKHIATDEFEDLNLDEESLELHKKALHYMKQNEGVEYVEAINKLTNS